jgi:NADH-quinone oxidoreductase subunit E
MDAAIARYPHEHRRSAAMPLLHLWQEHFGFINDDAVTWIAAKLGLQPINILELVTFYPMFRQKPAGKTHIRVCRTLSCAMAGGFQLMENLCAATGINREGHGEGMHDPIAVSPDGNYSVEFVECLASCGTAPACMVNENLHENRQDRTSNNSAPLGTPIDFQEPRTRGLDHRHRLLSARERLRTIEASADHVSYGDCQQSQKLGVAWPRRRRFFVRAKMELHQT